MGYERYPGGSNPQGDDYNRSQTQDYGRDYGAGRSASYSSSRNHQVGGESGSDRDRDRSGDYGQRDYGRREYGNAGYNRDRGGSGQQQYGQSGQNYGQQNHGSYAADGRRFEDVGQRRDWDDNDRRPSYGSRSSGQRDYASFGGDRERGQQRGGGSGRQPQGYDYEERGFFARAGDEVRSWFGDEDAERRREYDMREDDRSYGQQRHERDADYHNWRSGQISALDRDYDEYRQENRSRFENEFASWRSERQDQRDALSKVNEHMDVVGSDGEHVGTVDKVKGDRILLTKSDPDAGGHHHSIPSRWINSVDTQVKLRKTAEEAKKAWRDEDRNAATSFGDRGSSGNEQEHRDSQGRMLNRSFSGTY